MFVHWSIVMLRKSARFPAAAGSAKFWVTEGVLSKMEIKVDGSIEFNGNETEVVRTTTTEIQNVGSTKIDVSAAAKEKLK